MKYSYFMTCNLMSFGGLDDKVRQKMCPRLPQILYMPHAASRAPSVCVQEPTRSETQFHQRLTCNCKQESILRLSNSMWKKLTPGGAVSSDFMAEIVDFQTRC